MTGEDERRAGLRNQLLQAWDDTGDAAYLRAAQCLVKGQRGRPKAKDRGVFYTVLCAAQNDDGRTHWEVCGEIARERKAAGLEHATTEAAQTRIYRKTLPVWRAVRSATLDDDER